MLHNFLLQPPGCHGFRDSWIVRQSLAFYFSWKRLDQLRSKRNLDLNTAKTVLLQLRRHVTGLRFRWQ